jgi:hypothetical protein
MKFNLELDTAVMTPSQLEALSTVITGYLPGQTLTADKPKKGKATLAVAGDGQLQENGNAETKPAIENKPAATTNTGSDSSAFPTLERLREIASTKDNSELLTLLTKFEIKKLSAIQTKDDETKAAFFTELKALA